MGSDEESDKAVWVGFPDVEGEVYGFWVGFDVVVADEDGSGSD